MMQNGHERDIDIHVWCDAERSLLFDFLVRMTADLERAQAETFEVIQVFKKSLREPLGHREMRCQLFRTARNFNADCWFRSPVKLLERVYVGTNRQQDLKRLENFVCELGAAEREMMLLRYRYGFLSQEIASIVGRSVQQVQSSINQSVLQLRRVQPDLDINQLKQFPLFPFVEFETATLAIEDIVEKIPRPWQRYAHRMIWLIILGLGALLLVYWQKPVWLEQIPYGDQVMELISQLKNLWQESSQP